MNLNTNIYSGSSCNCQRDCDCCVSHICCCTPGPTGPTGPTGPAGGGCVFIEVVRGAGRYQYHQRCSAAAGKRSDKR